MRLCVGDRVLIRPTVSYLDSTILLAKELGGKRAWVVKEPWFLPLFGCQHVILSVDDGKFAEIDLTWCANLSAVDRLAELSDPPPPPLEW